MHVFLTGEIQVGKSTAIRRFLETKRRIPCGFRTFWRTGEARRELLLAPYAAPACEGVPVAVRTASRTEAWPEVFDALAPELLRPIPGADIMIMDELGFLERAAHGFQAAVLGALDGPLPVLGVVKPIRSDFLDAVCAHPGVHTMEVTPENREDILFWLCQNFQRA